MGQEPTEKSAPRTVSHPIRTTRYGGSVLHPIPAQLRRNRSFAAIHKSSITPRCRNRDIGTLDRCSMDQEPTEKSAPRTIPHPIRTAQFGNSSLHPFPAQVRRHRLLVDTHSSSMALRCSNRVIDTLESHAKDQNPAKKDVVTAVSLSARIT